MRAKSLQSYASLSNFGQNTAIILFLNLGVLLYIGRLGWFIRKGACAGTRYTRIMVPSFLFILFADIFFVIVSILEGGIFRGWLAKKRPTDA